MIRRSIVLFTALVLATSLLASCGKKADQTASVSASDSLLLANPVEQPQGQISPQTGVAPGGTTEQATPAPATQGSTPAHKPAKKPAPSPKPAPEAPSATVFAGTMIKVGIDTPITSETAHAGDSWSGTVSEAVTVGSVAPFPAGSVVHGVVEGVEPAEKGGRAFLVLRATSIEAGGQSHGISATADSMIAGSTRKRNIGAIAGGAAAGALLGKAVGGSNKGALIGGLLGGAAATGVVAKSKGFQVEVEKGKQLVFKVDQDTKIQL